MLSEERSGSLEALLWGWRRPLYLEKMRLVILLPTPLSSPQIPTEQSLNIPRQIDSGT